MKKNFKFLHSLDVHCFCTCAVAGINVTQRNVCTLNEKSMLDVFYFSSERSFTGIKPLELG